MGLDHTEQEIAQLREAYATDQRGTALRLAQRLSWYSMELALVNQRELSQQLWMESLEVARHVLDDGGPTQYERTELIRICVGAAHAKMQAGQEIEALEIISEAEYEYQQLAEQTDKPASVIALRGAILGARAEVFRDRGDHEVELEILCESVLELLSGSDANPMIVRSMLREPLRHLHGLLAADADV